MADLAIIVKHMLYMQPLYHSLLYRFMQLLSLVPTDPNVLQRLGDMYEDSDKSQSFQYYLEATSSAY